MRKLNAADSRQAVSLPGGAINHFLHGLRAPFAAFAFIRRTPSLWKYIILPLLINIATFCLVIYLFLGPFFDYVMAKLPQGEAWYWLIFNYFLMAVALLIILVLVFFTFAVVGSFIASPFNDALSAQTEEVLTGAKLAVPFSLSAVLHDAARTLIVESKKIGIFLLGMAALLALQLLPVVGTLLSPLFSIGWTILFLVVEYTGYVFSRKQLDFSSQRRIIYRNSSVLLGFGAGLFCVLIIPFMQFLCIPLGVVGAVRLLAELGELPGELRPE